MPEYKAAPPEPAHAKTIAKQFYIKKTLLEKYGWRPGCPACDSTLSSRREGGKFHTTECRSRIEAAAESNDADRVRLTTAYAKQHETKRTSTHESDADAESQETSKAARRADTVAELAPAVRASQVGDSGGIHVELASGQGKRKHADNDDGERDRGDVSQNFHAGIQKT